MLRYYISCSHVLRSWTLYNIL